MLRIHRILLGVILIAALWIRVYRLNAIPVGMTDDEVRLVYNAYSLFHTGRDIAQHIFLPFSFVLHNFSFTPVSVYVTAPFVGFMGLTPFAARLPFALAGVGVVLLTYLTMKRLTGQATAALLAAAVLTVNVWAIQISRIAYESGFALLLYVYGTYVFLGSWKARSLRPVLYSMLLLFLGFNSYNATKLLYLPLLGILTWFRWKDIYRYRPYMVCIIASALVTLGSFWFLSATQGAGAHGGDISILQGPAAQAVELSRRASVAPQVLKTLYHNKLTYYGDLIARHYLYAFSPDYLFLSQEGSGIYSLWSRGNLYLIELPFLFIGLLALVMRQRKIALLIILLVIISAIPSGIGPPPFTYATRSSFMLPWLALLIGYGVYTTIVAIRRPQWRVVSASVIILFYVYAVGGYFTQYYFEWPRYSAKSFAQDQKEIISFIQRYPDKRMNFIISNVSDMFLLQYAFYTQLDPRIVQQAYAKNRVPNALGNIHIIPECSKEIPDDTVYVTLHACKTKNPSTVITLPDGQIEWDIVIPKK